MAAQGRAEPQRWSQRQRQGIYRTKSGKKGNLKVRQRWRRHAAKLRRKGSLVRYGQRQGAADEGWQEDEIEALTRGMGASRIKPAPLLKADGCWHDIKQQRRGRRNEEDGKEGCKEIHVAFQADILPKSLQMKILKAKMKVADAQSAGKKYSYTAKGKAAEEGAKKAAAKEETNLLLVSIAGVISAGNQLMRLATIPNQLCAVRSSIASRLVAKAVPSMVGA